MKEERYKSNKYIRCYCEKKKDILVGAKLNRFINTFFIIPGCAFLSLIFIVGSLEIIMKIGAVLCIVLIPVVLSWIAYSHAKKEMLNGGHTEYCSRKIAYLAVLYDGTYGDFKIMKDKEN